MLEIVVAILLVVLLTALALYEHERQPGETRRDEEDRPPEWW
jgi:type II secretory pathway pseudopilin PulG